MPTRILFVCPVKEWRERNGMHFFEPELETLARVRGMDISERITERGHLTEARFAVGVATVPNGAVAPLKARVGFLVATAAERTQTVGASPLRADLQALPRRIRRGVQLSDTLHQAWRKMWANLQTLRNWPSDRTLDDAVTRRRLRGG